MTTEEENSTMRAHPLPILILDLFIKLFQQKLCVPFRTGSPGQSPWLGVLMWVSSQPVAQVPPTSRMVPFGSNAAVFPARGETISGKWLSPRRILTLPTTALTKNPLQHSVSVNCQTSPSGGMTGLAPSCAIDNAQTLALTQTMAFGPEQVGEGCRAWVPAEKSLLQRTGSHPCFHS